MRTKDVEKIDPFAPGLVITPEGEFIVMGDENHDRFFQNIIGREMMKLGERPTISNESDLGVLMGILLSDFKILPYCGCTPGSRALDGAFLYTNPLSTLPFDQLTASLSLYDYISSQYHIDLVEVNFNQLEGDRFMKREDLLLELSQRKSTRTK